jgi:DNA-binding transcriptional regulator LsrR (DeoR family)
MLDAAHQELLAQVASLYYSEELTQDAIATQLGLSRVKIYRLLKQARQEGVIQFTINWPLQRDQELERALCQRFGLQEALVFRANPQDLQHTLQRLGALAARYLEQILKDGMTLTVCLGRSTYEAINAIRPGFQAKVQVVQALGSMAFAQQSLDSATLARLLAQKLGGEVTYLAAPGMADNAEAAAILRRQRDIQRVLTLAQSAQVALLGIGNLDPTLSSFVKAGLITAEEMNAMQAEGAVGDMGGQVFTADGHLLDHSWNQRVIGLQLHEMQRIGLTIAVAAGLPKAAAILGALRTSAVDVLCTDDETAQAVLALESDKG